MDVLSVVIRDATVAGRKQGYVPTWSRLDALGSMHIAAAKPSFVYHHNKGLNNDNHGLPAVRLSRIHMCIDLCTLKKCVRVYDGISFDTLPPLLCTSVRTHLFCPAEKFPAFAPSLADLYSPSFLVSYTIGTCSSLIGRSTTAPGPRRATRSSESGKEATCASWAFLISTPDPG